MPATGTPKVMDYKQLIELSNQYLQVFKGANANLQQADLGNQEYKAQEE